MYKVFKKVNTRKTNNPIKMDLGIEWRSLILKKILNVKLAFEKVCNTIGHQ